MNANNLFKAVSDETRLKIISILIKGDKCVEEIANQLNIGISTVSFHLKKLTTVGLVSSKKEQYYQIYHVNSELLHFSLLDVINKNEGGFEIDFDTDNDCYEREAESYFENGVLKKIPTKLMVREAVLKKIALNLKKKSYTKKQLLIELIDVADDFVTVYDLLIKSGYITQKGSKILVADKAIKKIN